MGNCAAVTLVFYSIYANESLYNNNMWVTINNNNDTNNNRMNYNCTRHSDAFAANNHRWASFNDNVTSFRRRKFIITRTRAHAHTHAHISV